MAESSLEQQESRDHYFVRNLIKDPEASRDFDPGPFTQAKRFAHQILHPSLIIVRFPQTSTLLWLNRLLLLSGYHPPRLQAVCSTSLARSIPARVNSCAIFQMMHKHL